MAAGGRALAARAAQESGRPAADWAGHRYRCWELRRDHWELGEGRWVLGTGEGPLGAAG